MRRPRSSRSVAAQVCRAASRSSAPSSCATSGQRPVDAGPEAVGQQVVRLPGGRRRRRCCPGRRCPGAARTWAGRAPAITAAATHAEQLGVPLDEGGPAGGEARWAARAAGPCSASCRRSRRLSARMPDEREQCGQQGHGGGDGQDHGQRGGDGDAVEEAEPQDQHAEQGDTDGGPGEDDGTPGGGDGVLRGLGDRQTALQAAPVPGDDEQGVVDADAEPDQHAEHRGEVGDGHQRARAARCPAYAVPTQTRAVAMGSRLAASEPKARKRTTAATTTPMISARWAADDFGEGDDAAAQLHLEPVGRRRPSRCRRRSGPAHRDVVGLLVEGDRGVGGVSVRADLPDARGPVGAGDVVRPRAAPRSRAVSASSSATTSVARTVDAGGVPDDGVGVAAEAVEAVLEQLGGAARLGAGHLVVVGVRGTRDARRGGRAAEGEEPDAGRRGDGA